MRANGDAIACRVKVFIDDFTRKVFVYFLVKKSKVSRTFKDFVILVERQTGMLVRTLRTDNGREYVNQELQNFLKRKGMTSDDDTTYTGTKWSSRANEPHTYRKGKDNAVRNGTPKIILDRSHCYSGIFNKRLTDKRTC